MNVSDLQSLLDAQQELRANLDMYDAAIRARNLTVAAEALRGLQAAIAAILPILARATEAEESR